LMGVSRSTYPHKASKMDFSHRKFSSLPLALQHKRASELLRKLFLGEKKLIPLYRNMESWLSLPHIDLESHEAISCRFHHHLEQANICWQEHSLLHVKNQDIESSVPFLPLCIYLCSLRSAFNVGSIFRTVESFRLGTLCLCPHTPGPDNPKVQKASMGTYEKVPVQRDPNLIELPRPWIALETASPSTPIHAFPFPIICTLFLGNEEFGVPKELLAQCDHIVEIPLLGSKNSLNVAAAFAIAAATIRQHFPS